MKSFAQFDVMARLTISLILLVNIEVLLSTNELMPMSYVDNPYTSLWTSSYELTAYNSIRSITDCAARCLEHNDTCGAISFEPDTKSCTTGICVITQPVTRSPSLNMYQVQPALCNSTPGFNVETNSHTSACLWWSTTQKTFIDAKTDCMSKGAILGTFKTYKKFELLRRKNNIIYIGLDDMVEEGVFRWHDDNSIMDMNYSKQMFYPGDPNNYNNEDCIMNYYQQLLMDINCWNAYFYVCEKMCFTF